MTFDLIAATIHKLVYRATSEATPDSGTVTNVILAGDAIPGPLADFLARDPIVAADIAEETRLSLVPEDVVSQWSAAPAPDGGDQYAVPMEADTDASTALVTVELVHTMVR